jgi:hypothetical protein
MIEGDQISKRAADIDGDGVGHAGLSFLSRIFDAGVPETRIANWS